MKQLFSFLLAGLFLSALSAQSTPFFPEELVVTVNTLNLRDAPSMEGKKIASVSRGAVLQFVEAHNNGEYVQLDTTSQYAPWLKVRYKDKTGYVFGAYVTGTYTLVYEDDMMENVPPLLWYGVYKRDSFADEIRRVDLRIEQAYSEMYGSPIKVLKTNQKEPSKFLIGTNTPLKTGYAGPLGMYNVGDFYTADGLFPGAQLSIFPGQEPNDTTFKSSYQLAATGCAQFVDDFVQIKDYHLYIVDYMPQPAVRQEITNWIMPEIPELNPSVSLLWYGDLDADGKPDAILQDCPYEAGCRASLFLSSKARKGEFIRKICEHFWPGE